MLDLDPATIEVGWRARADLGDVAQLATSIAKEGQTTPVGVRQHGKAMVLVCGMRRVEACKRLGITVRAEVLEPEDEPHALELQLAENLSRKDLDALELGEGLKQLKQIYEGRHPETRRGAAGGGRRGAGTRTKTGLSETDKPVADRFTLHAGRMLGAGETKVKELLAVADLPASAKKDINKLRNTRERNAAVRQAVGRVRMTRKLKNLDRQAEEAAAKRVDPVEPSKPAPVAEGGEKAVSKIVLTLTDNRKWLAELGDVDPFVDLLCTDPPYETERQSLISHAARKDIKTNFGDWDKLDVGWLVAFARLLRSGAQVLAHCPAEALGDYKFACAAAGLVYRGHLVWHKTNPGTQHRPGYLSSTEHIVWATKGDKFYFKPWENSGARECHNMLEGPICGGNERLGHPCQKPSWLIATLLERHSSPEHQVLDPYAGVGTTLAVCKQRNQPCIGIEINQEFCGRAIKRLRAIS